MLLYHVLYTGTLSFSFMNYCMSFLDTEIDKQSKH